MGIQSYRVYEVLFQFRDARLVLFLFYSSEHIFQHAHRILISRKLHEIFLRQVVELDSCQNRKYFDDFLNKVSRRRVETKLFKLRFYTFHNQFQLFRQSEERHEKLNSMRTLLVSYQVWYLQVKLLQYQKSLAWRTHLKQFLSHIVCIVIDNQLCKFFIQRHYNYLYLLVSGFI